MLFHIMLFIAGLALLLKGADSLVEGASRLAKHIGVSPLIIGITVVALGTTTPELAVSFIAAVEGNGEIAIGNAVGSIIANIGIVLAIAAIIRPLKIRESTRKTELPLMAFAVILLMILSFDFISGPSEMKLSRGDGIMLIVACIAFLYYMFLKTKKKGKGALEKEVKQKEIVKNKRSPAIYILFILLGVAGVVIGGQLLVDSAVFIALSLGVSESIIALTILSIGTSIPELTTAAVASFKRQGDIAIGDIIGSNIFDIVSVLGFSAAAASIKVSSPFIIDMIVALFFAAILVPLFATHRKLSRQEGAMLLVMYGFYIAYLLLK